jgi:hypothetical protein
MYRWVELVTIDHEFVTTGRLTPAHRRGHRLSYSDIPGAQTRVLFLVSLGPAVGIVIVNIDDASFGLEE